MINLKQTTNQPANQSFEVILPTLNPPVKKDKQAPSFLSHAPFRPLSPPFLPQRLLPSIDLFTPVPSSRLKSGQNIRTYKILDVELCSFYGF